jgi:hypothetical protein
MESGVYSFNPFSEGYVARGKAFTPVKHQAMLAADLANLPQFLCGEHDVVLTAKQPSPAFLNTLRHAGFPLPEFVELTEGRINAAGSLCQRKIGALRPWAWGPDSITLFEPLFSRMAGEARTASDYFNDAIARLYSKAWSAGLLREVLARCRKDDRAVSWLCSEQDVGVAVDTQEEALSAIAAIRGQGHHRVLVKEAHGLAGHNAIRLWEPELLPAQRQWMARALSEGRQLVVERWLERVMDFSVQLEMGPRLLRLCGYTGLVNDPKGQFLANWAEPDCSRSLPAKVGALFPSLTDNAQCIGRLYEEFFSLLETELQRAGFAGPVSIDAFVFRTAQGDCRLKPIVEINPRYTMGRLTVELMKRAAPGTRGLFRLVTRAQAQAEGSEDLAGYSRILRTRSSVQLEGAPSRRIRQGAVCLNDPVVAQVCLATFEVGPARRFPDVLNIAPLKTEFSASRS